MTPRVVTLPPTDGAMWRKLLARCHPDAGGSHELFIWAEGLRGHIAGGGSELPPRRRGPGHDVERVPFPISAGVDFAALTRRALEMAQDAPEPYAALLGLLSDCGSGEGTQMVREQERGASYRRLAAIGHLVGMDKSARVRWYRIAEAVPLSDRHAGYLLERLKREA